MADLDEQLIKGCLEALGASHSTVKDLTEKGGEMLRVLARRAGDNETVGVVDSILQQEQNAASKIEGLLEQVSEYDLREMGFAA